LAGICRTLETLTNFAGVDVLHFFHITVVEQPSVCVMKFGGFKSSAVWSLNGQLKQVGETSSFEDGHCHIVTVVHSTYRKTAWKIYSKLLS
jgi:hypothetical protein